MTNWVMLTNATSGEALALNLARAVWITPNPDAGCLISFGAGDVQAVTEDFAKVTKLAGIVSRTAGVW